LPRQKILAPILEILSVAKVPLSVARIADKVVEKNLLPASPDLRQRISIALSQATRQSKRKRPRFVKLGRAYGLGSWLRKWPPTVADASYYVLLGRKLPMHYAELSGNIRRIGPVKSLKGKTPDVSVNVTLSSDRRFVNFGQGNFGLRGWRKTLLKPNDFSYSTPAENWTVSQKVAELLKKADEMVRVSSPYVDKSTFETFLDQVPTGSEIHLLVSDDKQLPTKINEGLSSEYISAWMRLHRMKIRRLSDLHSRFIVIDDSISLVTSADLMKDQQQRKHQYLLSSSDPETVRKSSAYFDEIWLSGQDVDILAEIKRIEAPKT